MRGIITSSRIRSGPNSPTARRAVLAVGDDLHVVASLLHQELERDHDVGLVVGDQNLLAHASLLRRGNEHVRTRRHSGRWMLSGRGLRDRQLEDERRAFARHALHPESAAEVLDDLAADRQPEARCRGASRSCVSPAWRNFSKMIRWSSTPMPGPLSATSPAAVRPSVDTVRSTRPSSGPDEFDRIGQQIDQHLHQAIAVRMDERVGFRAGVSRAPTFFARNSCPVALIESSMTAFRSTRRPAIRRGPTPAWRDPAPG